MKEKYPTDRARERAPPPSADALKQILLKAKAGEGLKKVLNPHLGRLQRFYVSFFLNKFQHLSHNYSELFT